MHIFPTDSRIANEHSIPMTTWPNREFMRVSARPLNAKRNPTLAANILGALFMGFIRSLSIRAYDLANQLMGLLLS